MLHVCIAAKHTTPSRESGDIPRQGLENQDTIHLSTVINPNSPRKGKKVGQSVDCARWGKEGGGVGAYISNRYEMMDTYTFFRSQIVRFQKSFHPTSVEQYSDPRSYKGSFHFRRSPFFFSTSLVISATTTRRSRTTTIETTLVKC